VRRGVVHRRVDAALGKLRRRTGKIEFDAIPATVSRSGKVSSAATGLSETLLL